VALGAHDGDNADDTKSEGGQTDSDRSQGEHALSIGKMLDARNSRIWDKLRQVEEYWGILGKAG
jgi:hypothetical protein